MPIINQFYKEKEQYSEKERLLQESIQKRRLLIAQNDANYKKLLVNNEEKEADELFSENSILKNKQQSETAKLASYKEIHKEALIKKAFDVLDTDLIELTDLYIDEYIILLEKEKELQDRLAELSEEKRALDQKVNREFSKYDQLAEKFRLKQVQKARFNREPYALIIRPSGRLQQKAVKKIEKREKEV